MVMFKIGQKVVCVDANFDATRKDSGVVTNPVKNGIYTIREIMESGSLRFEEIKNPVLKYVDGIAEVAFLPHRFRPLIDDNFAEELLAKIKEEVQSEFQLN